MSARPLERSPGFTCPSADSRRRQALLITDRAFIHGYDGSATVYRAWLTALRQMGFDVAVLSFNYPRVRWDEESLEQLRSCTSHSLIIDLYPNLPKALARHLSMLLFRFLVGRRHMPERLEDLFRSAARGRIARFLQEVSPRLIVVNKVRTTHLVGIDLLEASPALRLLDIHDNLPRRAALNRQALWRLAIRCPLPLARSVTVQDVSDVCNWSSEARMTREELRRLAVYDGVMFNSPDEAEAFVVAGLPRDKAHIVHWPLYLEPPSAAARKVPSFDVGFIASDAPFNLEAFEFFCRSIAPRLLKEKPDSKILITGNICRSAQSIIPDGMNLTLLPWVDNVSTFYDQIAVSVIPLLNGTGVSIKAIEASMHRTPVVSTPVGLRALGFVHGLDALVADAPDAFAACIGQLLSDQLLQRKLANNAFAKVNRAFSFDSFVRDIDALIGER